MTATPDRPATTPEGAGLAAEVERLSEAERLRLQDAVGRPVPTHSHLWWVVAGIRADAYAAGLAAAVTEGAGEVALSEAERDKVWEALAIDRPNLDGVLSDAMPAVVSAVERILARRALPTVGRVVEVERVAEQVGALAYGESASAVLHGVVGTTPDTYGGVTKDEALDHAADLVNRLRALAAAIRAGEEGGK